MIFNRFIFNFRHKVFSGKKLDEARDNLIVVNENRKRKQGTTFA